MTTSHDDLHRDIGGLEATVDGMEKRLDRIEKAIEDGFRELRKDIADLKLKDGQRSAVEKAAVWISGVIGAGFAILIEHFWR